VSYKGSVDKWILLVSGMLLLGKLHLICGNIFNQNITFHFMLLLRPKLSESILLPEDTTKLLLCLWYGSYSSVRCIIVDMVFRPHRAFFFEWLTINPFFYFCVAGWDGDLHHPQVSTRWRKLTHHSIVVNYISMYM
jgi:hypothetical protein